MGFEDFHRALKDYLDVRKSSDSSDQHSFPLAQAKKSLENALEQIIDTRVKTQLAKTQRRTTNPYVSGPPLKTETDEDTINMIDALNSCPIPPDNMRWFVGETALNWMKAYTDWYNEKRARALKKG